MRSPRYMMPRQATRARPRYVPVVVEPEPEPPTGDYGTVQRTVLADTVSNRTITWTLGSPKICDRWISGEWFVVAPGGVTVTVSPAFNPTTKLHGSQKNWVPHIKHGFTGYRWPPVLNAAGQVVTPGATADFPGWDPTREAGSSITLNPGDTLFSSIGVTKEDAPSGQPFALPDSFGGPHPRPGLWRVAILTCVDSLPAQHSFRPAPNGNATKKLAAGGTRYFNRADYQAALSSLPSLPRVAGTPASNPQPGRLANYWLIGVGSPDPVTVQGSGWFNQYLSAHAQMGNYGEYWGLEVGEALLQCCYDYPTAQKIPLIEALIQRGIDHYGAIEGGWQAGWGTGGHQQGVAVTTLFAGKMLGNSQYLNFLVNMTDFNRRKHVSEINQVFRPTAAQIPLWNNVSPKIGVAGQPHWCQRTGAVPDIPGGYHYFTANTMRTRAGTALASYILGLKDKWAAPDWFDLQDWYCSPSSPVVDLLKFSNLSTFRAAWNAYRANYPPIYSYP